MKKFLLICLVLFLGSFSLFAQQDMTKFGVIDTSKVYSTFFRDSSGVRNYETKKAEFQAEVDKRTAELQQLQQKKVEYKKLNNERDLLRVEAEITQKTDFLNEYTRVKQIELESLKQKLDVSDSFYSSMWNSIERIAEAEGFSMILSLQQANAILWYSPSIDITDKVIKDLGL